MKVTVDFKYNIGDMVLYKLRTERNNICRIGQISSRYYVEAQSTPSTIAYDIEFNGNLVSKGVCEEEIIIIPTEVRDLQRALNLYKQN